MNTIHRWKGEEWCLVSLSVGLQQFPEGGVPAGQRFCSSLYLQPRPTNNRGEYNTGEWMDSPLQNFCLGFLGAVLMFIQLNLSSFSFVIFPIVFKLRKISLNQRFKPNLKISFLLSLRGSRRGQACSRGLPRHWKRPQTQGVPGQGQEQRWWWSWLPIHVLYPGSC